MDTQLTHAARFQLAQSLRRRYQAASSRAKKQILNEFIAVSGYHREVRDPPTQCKRRSRSSATGTRASHNLRRRREAGADRALGSI